MTEIETALTKVLRQGGDMDRRLYELELQEHVPFFQQSLEADGNEYLFVVTENAGQVAMVLVNEAGEVLINEQARARLQMLWPAAYEHNMRQFIPLFARQLRDGEFPITGVNTVP